MDILSQEEFRAAIESKFGLEMSDERFRSMLDRMPLDEEGNVKYADFMAQFDTRCVGVDDNNKDVFTLPAVVNM